MMFSNKDDNDRMRNKREIAWASFLFIIFTGILSFFYVPKSPETLTTILWICAGFVGAYIGVSTVADYKMFGANENK